MADALLEVLLEFPPEILDTGGKDVFEWKMQIFIRAYSGEKLIHQEASAVAKFTVENGLPTSADGTPINLQSLANIYAGVYGLAQDAERYAKIAQDAAAGAGGFSFNYFYASPAVIEAGKAHTVTLNWSFNKTVAVLKLNDTNIDASATSYELNNVSPNSTFTLYAEDEEGNSIETSVTVYKAYPFYYGDSTNAKKEDVSGLDTSVALDDSGVYEVIIDNAGYIYFICKGKIESIIDKNTNFGVAYNLLDYNINLTIEGVPCAYNVYRTAELIKGTYPLKVEVSYGDKNFR